MPAPWVYRIAGAGVMIGAGHFALQKFHTFEAAHHNAYNADMEGFNYDSYTGSHGVFSDQKSMNKYAKMWKRFWKLGPNGLFVKIKHAMHDVEDFIKEYVLTPNVSWLAVGGAYMAGIPVHKIVAAPFKFIWKTNVLQSAGKGIFNFFANANYNWLKKGMQFMLGTPPGLLMTAAALYLGYMFKEHVSGDYQRKFVEPVASYPVNGGGH